MTAYFGKIEINNITTYGDGSILPINFLKRLLDTSIVDSIHKIFLKCFPDNSFPSTAFPSTIYILSLNPDGTEIISTASVTRFLPEYLSKSYNAHYIFNVCTDHDYRKRGLASMLINNIFQDYKKQGINYFILEVLSHNTNARRLYENIGFNYVKTYVQGGRIIDLLEIII